jgi:prolyl oligopeptidase
LCTLPAPAQTSGLQRLFTDYYEFTLRDNPARATSLGRNEYNDHWNDPSPEYQAIRRAELASFRNRLLKASTPQLSPQDRLSLRILEWRLNDEIEELDTLGTYNSVNHFFGGHLNVFSTMALAPANTVKDYENQIARLNAIPKWTEQTIAAASFALAHKQIQPKLVAQLVVKQLETQAAPEPMSSPLLKAFTRFPASIPPAEQQRLKSEAVAAYQTSFQPSWKKFHDYLNNTYLPAARSTTALSENFNGNEMYRFRVKSMTTTSYTPEQIHSIGLREVARIQAEMASIRKQLSFTGTPQEFSDQVLNAPQFRFHSEPEILAHGRDIAKRIDPELPKLFRVLPRIPYGVAAIPADRARTAAPYYQGPSLDGSRAGFFYLRTVDPELQSNCCMEALILHESVPGHHLQIALANEMQGVPEFRKTAGFTAFIEGWGLYAESLGSRLGLYETPYERYGQLQSEIFRAARLVVDTGLHTKGWSREQAIDYLYSNGANPSRDFLSSEVDRYIAIPGQALAYKVGELKIQELRARAEKELGPKFDIREFHNVVLRNGALPLDILEEQVVDWIRQSK